LCFLAAILALIGLMIVIGWLLPRGHTATRAAHFSASPEMVWDAITDFARFPAWRHNIARVETLPERDGHSRWVEHDAHNAISYEAVERVPPTGGTPGKMVTRIGPNLPFGGTWTFELVPAGSGTELRITERGEIYNPIFRFVSLFMSQTKTIENYLQALGHKFGETPAITP